MLSVTVPGKHYLHYIKGTVHFEIDFFWYVLAYLMGIQHVGVFVSTVVLI